MFANLPSRGSLCVQESLSMTSLCTLPKEILRYTILLLIISPYIQPLHHHSLLSPHPSLSLTFILLPSHSLLYRSTLLKLPPNDICSQVNFVNQHLHGQVTKEEFWKELCVVRYCGASSALLSKPPAHSWKQYAFQLGKER